MDNNNSRRILVQKYFLKRPTSPDYSMQVLFGLGGLVLVYVGFSMPSYINARTIFIVAGLIVTAIQVVKMVQKYNEFQKIDEFVMGKATDAQMDEWLKNDKQMILKESLQSLNMDYNDSNASPFMIDGPAEKALIAKGEDNVLRYSAHNILIFHLTEHHVATFQCILDMATGCIVSQYTKEFPYKDITNLETSTVNKFIQLTNNKKTGAIGYQEFSLHTSGVNKIAISYLFDKSMDKDDDSILPPSDAERTIKAVRKRLKEYKDRFGVGVTEMDMV